MPQRSSSPRPTHAADLAECRLLLRDGSRTFLAASMLLPRSVREPAAALYAFCRLADDAIDNGGGQAVLWQWRERLHRIYAGRPLPIATDRAFTDVIERFAIPRALPEALLDGFAWDADGRRYEDIAALEAYAARVAGSVGAMMALMMDVDDPDLVARACDLGVAMQLSNIARDVGEDARAGRLYLPLAWLREAGIAPDAWLARPVFNAALAQVMRRLLAAADATYARADAGIARLPRSCRHAIRAARLLYADIGHEVARRGYDAVSQRAVVPASRKTALLLRALASGAAGAADHGLPALAATQHLVSAVAMQPQKAASQAARARPIARPARNVEWMLDLFERLERREYAERSLAGD
jgi:phytoene synthase